MSLTFYKSFEIVIYSFHYKMITIFVSIMQTCEQMMRHASFDSTNYWTIAIHIRRTECKKLCHFLTVVVVSRLY